MVQGDNTGTLVTRAELAKRLECHEISITRWQREGLPVARRGGRGRASLYDEVAVRAWLLAREAAAKAQAAPLDLAQERARKERWQGLLAEQMFKVRERLLLPVADVEKAWLAEVTAVRAVILASYTADADRVYRAATLDGVVGVERELKDLAERVLRELASQAPATRKRKRKRPAA